MEFCILSSCIVNPLSEINLNPLEYGILFAATAAHFFLFRSFAHIFLFFEKMLATFFFDIILMWWINVTQTVKNTNKYLYHFSVCAWNFIARVIFFSFDNIWSGFGVLVSAHNIRTCSEFVKKGIQHWSIVYVRYTPNHMKFIVLHSDCSALTTPSDSIAGLFSFYSVSSTHDVVAHWCVRSLQWVLYALVITFPAQLPVIRQIQRMLQCYRWHCFYSMLLLMFFVRL